LNDQDLARLAYVNENAPEGLAMTLKFYGWYLLAVLFALDFINMGFPYYGGSVINGYMIHQIPMSRGTLGLGFTLLNLAVGLSAVVVASHIVRFGVRATFIAGSAMICFGSLFLAIVCSKPWHYLVAFGIVNGIGIGFATIVTIATAATRWFRSYRGRAIGIVFSGSAFSGFTVSWLLDRMLRAAGGNWRVGWYVVAAGAIVAGMVAAVFVKESPESIGQSVDGLASSEQSTPSRTDILATRFPWTAGQAYRTRAYWLIAIAGITSTYTSFFFVAHAILHMRGAGISSADAALAMGVFSIMTLVGRWLGGILMDMMNARLVYALGLAVVIVGTYYALGIRAGALMPAYLAAALYGMCHGWTFSCTPTMTGHYYGPVVFPKLYGTMMLFISAGASPAGYVGGKMFDRYGNYTAAILLNAALAAIGITAILFARMPTPSDLMNPALQGTDHSFSASAS
jgi:MFS family permease